MIFTEFDIDVAKEVWMEEARQDGEARKALEMVRAMIKDGISIETASKYSSIPADELRNHIN
jgi:hypothetical protein